MTTVLFGGVTLAKVIWPDRDMPVLGTLHLASFVVPSGAMIADYYFARHGLTRRRTGGGARRQTVAVAGICFYTGARSCSFFMVVFPRRTAWKQWNCIAGA